MSLQIGVHYNGSFYEFVPWNGVVNWEIAPWGYWYITAENENHLVIKYTASFILFSGASTKESHNEISS